MVGADVHAENRAVWDVLAPWWDDRIGRDGNAFHRQVIGPAAETLLGDVAGERVLDIACGNGQFSRRLAGRGAMVVAVDQSEPFLARARRHSQGPAEAAIDYRRVDVTDADAVAAAGPPASFDAAVANMALMDLPMIEPLFNGLGRLLRPGGRFVVTTIHPCFGYGPPAATERRAQMTNRVLRAVERLVPEGGRRMLASQFGALTSGLASLRYLEPYRTRAVGIVGQPRPHWYFHRPLAVLLGEAFAAGFMLDGLLEPPMYGERGGRPALLALKLRHTPSSP